MAELRIGTSGWNYKHWKGIFYPDDVAQRLWLEFYAQHFCTVEVNYSFYRLPSPETYKNWRLITPQHFLFALKCSRLITHIKRLSNLGDLWDNFLSHGTQLQTKLGPILCQFPDAFEVDPLRLSDFLSKAKQAAPDDCVLRLAVEFRHQSWFRPQIYRLLEKHNVALVVADSSQFPKREVHTADYAYYRYHGPGKLFGSSYTRAQLQEEAQSIKACLRQEMDVFGYFNNDGHGYAVKNALLLKELLGDAVHFGRACG